MNVLGTLAKAIKKGVYAAQKDLGKDLIGKNVIRNGTTFLVVDVTKDKIILSGTESELEQTNTINLKAFLSKKVKIIPDEKTTEVKS